MKSKFKLTLALMVISTLFVNAAGAEYNKVIKKGWPKNSITALQVTNKFGEIKINDLGGDSVTIKVVITSENPSQSRVKDLMDKIQIEFDKTGGLASAVTNFEENFISKQSFTIDYFINIPKDRELDINNRFGNVVINDLEAKGKFNISYGNLTAGILKAPSGSPVNVEVSYGQADIESVNDAKMICRYSKLSIGEAGQLKLESKYSGATNIHRVKNLQLDSKYDAIDIDEIGQLKAVSKYTNYKIGVLKESFDLDTGYGSVRINEVESKFDQIKIINSYGGISIGLGDLNYKLRAECSYCKVDFPADRYKGDKIRDNQNFSLDGTVGTGGGSVSINSRYGGVKLTN